MDKDLEEDVEKIIKEHEEKRLKIEAASPEKKKNKMKYVDTAILLIIIVGLVAWMAWPTIMQGDVERDTVMVHPANVVLDRFEDRHVAMLVGLVIEDYISDYVSVTFQLKNTGDEAAKDVSCFIKCCDQNGTILFAQLFTFGDIGPDVAGKIPATVSYKVPIDEVMYVIHNIDIRWSPQGTNTYVRLTEV